MLLTFDSKENSTKVVDIPDSADTNDHDVTDVCVCLPRNINTPEVTLHVLGWKCDGHNWYWYQSVLKGMVGVKMREVAKI